MSITRPSRPDLRALFERLGRAITVRRGECLFEQGDSSAGVYLMRNGYVGLFLAETPSQRVCVDVVGTGALIGLPAIVTESPSSITAEVLEDADVVFVPRDVVVKTLSQSRALCLQALDMLAHDVNEIQRALEAARNAVN